MARRDHPLRVPVRDRPPVHLADIRAIAGLADDLTTGTLDLSVDVGFDGTDARSRLDGRGARRRPGPTAARRGAGLRRPGAPARPDEPLADAPHDRRRRAPLRRADRGGLGRARPSARAAARRGWSAPGRGPGRRRPGPPRRRRLYPLTVALRSPGGDVVESAELRIGFRRVEIRGRGPAHQRRAGLPPRRQPPRLRPAHRTGHLGRVDARRPRPDEAVRVQRGPDLALPQRPGLLRPDRRARPVRHRRGGHRVRTRSRARCATTRATCRPWVDRVVADGRSATRTTRRSSSGRSATSRATAPTTTRPPPGSAATTRRGRSTTRARSAGTGPSDQGGSDMSCPMYPEIGAIVDHARSGLQQPPADHVRVLARDGQQQRDPGRVLGRDRVDARPAGRLHLGVVGPRPRPDAARRHDALGLRRRLRRRAQRRQLLHRRPGLAGPHARSRRCGSTRRWPRRSRVALDAGDLARGEVTIRNRQDWTGLDWLRARLELAVDGERGRDGRPAAAGRRPRARTRRSRSPGWTALAPTAARLWLTVRFTTAAETAWAPAGFEVAARAGARSTTSRASAPGAAHAAADRRSPSTRTARSSTTCSRRPPRLSLWRAPTDNDRIGGFGGALGRASGSTGSSGSSSSRPTTGPTATIVAQPYARRRHHEIDHEQRLDRARGRRRSASTRASRSRPS